MDPVCGACAAHRCESAEIFGSIAGEAAQQRPSVEDPSTVWKGARPDFTNDVSESAGHQRVLQKKFRVEVSAVKRRHLDPEISVLPGETPRRRHLSATYRAG
jgi:hypothetical protein